MKTLLMIVRYCQIAYLIKCVKQSYNQVGQEFGSFAFAWAVNCVSNKSKCAKSAVAVYRKEVKELSIVLISIALAITHFYVPITYHYHSIQSEICVTFVNITLPSRQSQNIGLTTNCLPYFTRCSNNKTLPEIELLTKFTSDKQIIK